LPPKRETGWHIPHLTGEMLLTHCRCGAALAVAFLFLNVPPAGAQTSARLPAQLDGLVAPIALFPDVLAASTYPIEIAEAQQWSRTTLSGKERN
jgi:hypothetical protein